MDFGSKPLSHPLLVETIEDTFLPVAIFINKPGRDAEILERFQEPSWNNPVVRFLDTQGKDLIPRQDRVWTTSALTQRMSAALEAAELKVPEYLSLLQLESDTSALQTATFAMHCFWAGEKKLGALPGVVRTRAGWLEGHEVVEVIFHPARLPYAELLREAQTMDCARQVYFHHDEHWANARKVVGDLARRAEGTARDAKRSDQHYYLQRSPYRHLALTSAQKTKVNAGLGASEDVRRFLSPRQLKDLALVRDGQEEASRQ